MSTPGAEARRQGIREAAKYADWVQVVLNGGPPCFHLEIDRFCLRAERWLGHGTDGRIHDHAFVPLEALVEALTETEAEQEADRLRKAALQESIDNCAQRVASLSKRLTEAETALAQGRGEQIAHDELLNDHSVALEFVREIAGWRGRPSGAATAVISERARRWLHSESDAALLGRRER